jgi:hypothetical protein
MLPDDAASDALLPHCAYPTLPVETAEPAKARQKIPWSGRSNGLKESIDRFLKRLDSHRSHR